MRNVGDVMLKNIILLIIASWKCALCPATEVVAIIRTLSHFWTLMFILNVWHCGLTVVSISVELRCILVLKYRLFTIRCINKYALFESVLSL